MLISSEYRELNRQLHKERSSYGKSGHKWVGIVNALCSLCDTRDVLDYGCGKGTLAKSLHFSIHEYDPAIKGVDTMPKAHDLVVCTDVLEHIEPGLLGNVLQHIHDLSLKGALLTIATRYANKNLPDGRNAHLIVEDRDWWMRKLDKWFDLVEFTPKQADELVFLAIPRSKQ